MNSKISKYYLLHFIHLPIVIVYSSYIGEDGNTITFIALLTSIISGIIYGYNLVVTLFLIKIISKTKYQIIPFLGPVLILIFTKGLWDETYNSLDFGNEGTKWYLIISSLIINVLSFYRINLSKISWRNSREL